MRESVGPRLLDARWHFRVLVASRPSVSCLCSRYDKTPSRVDGVFWVNRPRCEGNRRG